MNAARGVGSFSPPAGRGFTLLEVLIALAVLAVALGAAARAAGVMTDGAAALKSRLLAQWVAEDRLAWHWARRDWPTPGMVDGEARQVGRTFYYAEEVTATANAGFRRLAVRVYEDRERSRALAQLVGYLPRPRAGATE